MSDIERPRRLHIERDPDRARLEANEETVTAVGVQMPSGAIIIEWCREAFEPGDRANKTVTSRYECVEDAEQATAGTVVFEEDADE